MILAKRLYECVFNIHAWHRFCSLILACHLSGVKTTSLQVYVTPHPLEMQLKDKESVLSSYGVREQTWAQLPLNLTSKCHSLWHL